MVLVYKSKSERKIEKGRLIECIIKGCNKRANLEGLCWEHYEEERKEYNSTQTD